MVPGLDTIPILISTTNKRDVKDTPLCLVAWPWFFFNLKFFLFLVLFVPKHFFFINFEKSQTNLLQIILKHCCFLTIIRSAVDPYSNFEHDRVKESPFCVSTQILKQV